MTFKRGIVLAALMNTLATGAVAAEPTADVLPMPALIERCEGSWPLPANPVIQVNGQAGPRLAAAIARFRQGLKRTAGAEATVWLTISVAEPETAFPALDTDESYELHTRRQPTLNARTSYGVMHGLQTLSQLITDDRSLPCTLIRDHPRFAWRGLLLDVVRHWLPPAVVRRQLDAMAAYKMNVLHWHLSDDQGFRVESKQHPALHEQGSDGNYYSQTELRELIEYAADRGIRVVPEFDLPGHSRSWQIAYPQLSSRADKAYHLYHQDSLFSDPINPVPAANRALLDSIVAEMAGLFPDAYFHMGGDEVNTDAWEDNESIQAFIQQNAMADEHALQAWFIRHYQEHLTRLGKVAIGWDEVAESEYPPDAVVNKWRGRVLSEAETAHPLIISSGFYLDYMQTAWHHYQNDPGDMVNGDNALILGGEASAWAETIDQHTVDSRIWPRTLAIAELLWSPDEFTNQEAQPALYRRVALHSQALSRLGLGHQQQPDQWFRSLAGEHADSIQTLAAVVRPEMHAQLADEVLKLVRLPWQRQIANAPAPLDPFLGHLAPEPLLAWEFNQTVERYLAQPSGELASTLRRQLLAWRANHAPLVEAVKNVDELRDYNLEALSAGLRDLSDTGLAALSAIEQGRALPNRDLHRGRLARYAHIDPEMSMAWFKAQVFQFSNLFRPLILLKAKLPVQRGIARLVEAADSAVAK